MSNEQIILYKNKYTKYKIKYTDLKKKINKDNIPIINPSPIPIINPSPNTNYGQQNCGLYYL